MWIDYDCGVKLDASTSTLYIFIRCRQLRTGSGLVRIVIHITYIYVHTTNTQFYIIYIIWVCGVYTRNIIILIFSFTPFCVCGLKKVYILVLARRCVIDIIFSPHFRLPKILKWERERKREIPKPPGKKIYITRVCAEDCVKKKDVKKNLKEKTFLAGGRSRESGWSSVGICIYIQTRYDGISFKSSIARVFVCVWCVCKGYDNIRVSIK